MVHVLKVMDKVTYERLIREASINKSNLKEKSSRIPTLNESLNEPIKDKATFKITHPTAVDNDDNDVEKPPHDNLNQSGSGGGGGDSDQLDGLIDFLLSVKSTGQSLKDLNKDLINLQSDNIFLKQGGGGGGGEKTWVNQPVINNISKPALTQNDGLSPASSSSSVIVTPTLSEDCAKIPTNSYQWVQFEQFYPNIKT